MSQTIAVVAAHPDDEVLGCGATIARHVAAGDSVCVLIVAEGATSRGAQRSRNDSQAELSELAASASKAHQILGSTSLEMLDFPDNRMDGVELLDVAKAVQDFLAKTRAQVVYTHFPHDLNVDHRVVSEAVQIACRPVPGAHVRKVLMFEVPSSTEWRIAALATFSPNHFVDVSAHLDKKIAALSAYASEMRPWPHARSLQAVQALAQWRGASVGVAAAEAFVLGREVI
ncbi:MAG: PIG-L deacetylase family protein [Gammaproteobacteria bacterium]